MWFLESSTTLTICFCNFRFPKEKLILHDTALLGRPNVEKLVVDKVRECGAELVIVRSSPAGSKKVIDSCTAAEIAAFGPVWDS